MCWTTHQHQATFKTQTNLRNDNNIYCVTLCSTALYRSALSCFAMHVIIVQCRYCTVFHCRPMCISDHFVFYSSACNSIAKHGTVSHCIAMNGIELYCTASQCMVLYCNVLYDTVLQYRLYCMLLYCIAMCDNVLLYDVWYCTILQYTSLYYTVMPNIVLCCNVWYYIVSQCLALYCTAMCGVALCTAKPDIICLLHRSTCCVLPHCVVLQCMILYSIVLDCIAACCTVMDCTMVNCTMQCYFNCAVEKLWFRKKIEHVS